MIEKLAAWIAVIMAVIGGVKFLWSRYSEIFLETSEAILRIPSRIKQTFWPDPIYIKKSGIIMHGTCVIHSENCISPNGEKPITTVNTMDNNQINICQPCLEQQLENSCWKESEQ